jgi:hypothetical protein
MKPTLTCAQTKVLHAQGYDDFCNTIIEKYPDGIPLFHATTLENAELILKDGLKPVDGKNYKSWSSDPQVYVQIGRSDYQSTERPVVLKAIAPHSILQNAYADLDGVNVDEQDILMKYEVDIAGLDADTRDFILAFAENDCLFEGLELMLRDMEPLDPTFFKIDSINFK